MLFIVVATLLTLWLATLLLSTARVQKVVTNIATYYLSNYVGAKVEVGGIYYRFFNRLQLNNVLIEDLHQDTLFFAQSLEVKIQFSALFKKVVKVKSAELVNPVLYVHRNANETDFNFQFLADKFASKDTTASKPLELQIDINTLNITLFDFRFIDERNRYSFSAAFNNLSVSGIDFNTKANELLVDAIVMDDANVSAAKLKKFIYDLPALASKEKTETKQKNTKPSFKALLKYLLVSNTNFSYDNYNYEPQCKGIDYAHVMVSKVKLFAENITFKNDSLQADIQHISAYEQCGFTLNRLKADFLMTANMMEFDDLIIETPGSRITNYFAMAYDSYGDFSDFLNKVIMRATFRKAVVDIKDVNYFAKALDKIEHNVVVATGNVRGPVSNLKARSFFLDAGLNTRFSGNLDLRGLPNIEETFISATFDNARTDVNDINRIYPGIKFPKEAYALGLTRISGNFDGFINDFVTKARIVTQLGTINSDINLKFKNDIEYAAYKGTLTVTEFDLGKLINEPLLGKVSLNGKVEGSGLSLQTVETKIDGLISKIEANGYPYSNIDIEGLFTKSTFVGEAITNDPNCKFDFNGEVDFSNAIPEFDFKAQITHANLKVLNLLEEEISLKTDMQLNFSGIKIDDIEGLLDIRNTEITKKGKPYYIDKITLEALVFEDEGTKRLMLESDVLNAEVRGDIDFEDIGTTAKYFFSKYFRKNALDLDASQAGKYSQNFNFYVNINNGTGELTELLHDDFKEIGVSSVTGSFNSLENHLKLDLQCEHIDFGNFRIKNIDAVADGTPNEIFFRNSIDSLLYKDSLFTEKINFYAKLNRDTVNYHLTIQDTLNPNRVNLSGKLQSNLTSINNQLVNSTFHFNNEAWVVSNNNNLFFDGKQLKITNLNLAKDYHKISIYSEVDKDTSSNIAILLNDVLLEDILSAIPSLKKLNISGNANGRADIFDALRKPVPTATMVIDSLSLDNNLLGNMNIRSLYSQAEKVLNVNTQLLGENNNVAVLGKYFFTPENENLRFDAEIEKLDLAIANVFLKGIFSDTKGTGSGKLTLFGTPEKLNLTGKVNVKEVGSTVSFLNTKLNIANHDIVFAENKIELGNLTITDNNGNTAKAKGHIYHNHLQKFGFNINIDTDQFEFMNTTAAASSQFYGKAYGSAKVLIRGLLNNLVFDIKAVTQKNTKVSIAVSGGKDVSEYTFFRFVDKSKPEMVKERQYAKPSTGVDFNIDLTATPDAEVDLVLSSEQGDVIKAKGDGNLKIVYDKNQELSIIGTYTVSEGEYLFSMQNVISKKFKIDKGSQIVWAGNPYDARLAITASYNLRASPYDLIEDIVRSNNERMQQARIRLLVQLLLNIGGSISDPDISFDIKIPDADPAIRTAVNSKLDFIRLDKNLFDQQVVGLLVLNKFLPVQNAGQNADNSGSFVTGASNTVSEFVSNQLSNYLSDWLSNFVTDLQLDVNYRTYQSGLQSDNGATDDFESRRELQLALSKSFLNNRIYVDIGGNFDFSGTSSQGVTNNNQRGNNIAGDFEIQYALTPDGRYKLKAFSRGEYDVFTERNRNRTGIGIQYKKEFSDWKDLTTPTENRSNRKKKRKAEKQQMLKNEEEETN